MRKYILFLLGFLFAIQANAQNPFIDIPSSYWNTLNMEDIMRDANNGYAEAQFWAAIYYMDVKPDNAKFKNWIEKAAAQNHAEAQCLVAQLYAVGDYGFDLNSVKAVEYARKSASQNNVQAISMMAECYRFGLFGVPKDDSQAGYWYGRGARLDDVHCQYMLGTMYLYGIGVLKDEKEGLRWLQKSADQKYIKAQSSLIIFYANQENEESHRKLMSIGLDFLINPEISQNSEDILLAKGFLGFEFFNRKNYKRGIQLMREGMQIQNELLEFYWKTMNEYVREVLGTTIYALENSN